MQGATYQLHISVDNIVVVHVLQASCNIQDLWTLLSRILK